MKGEGHYIAVLKKVDGDFDPRLKLAQPKVDSNMLKHYKEFAKETLNFIPTGKYITFNDQLYILPEETLSLDKLKVVRPGLHLGTFKKNRFEPSHALALSLNREEVKNSWNLPVDSKEIISYLKGEVLQATSEKGWYLIEVDGYSIGWGKLAGNAMKNHYPKGLRWVGNFY
ncbi:NOL1/NOP2/sun family putative RNA methylase OS=Ureibacillus acetophenoni OX=614649 GN=SAMN05877842_10619 PE=3 SV=1 [Ureibacillus acetophenoni]